MSEDLSRYEVQKVHAQRWFLTKGDGNIDKAISILATMTSCPCIVVAYWLGEITNWPVEIKNAIDRLTEFYGYSAILNKPAGCPY